MKFKLKDYLHKDSFSDCHDKVILQQAETFIRHGEFIEKSIVTLIAVMPVMAVGRIILDDNMTMTNMIKRLLGVGSIEMTVIAGVIFIPYLFGWVLRRKGNLIKDRLYRKTDKKKQGWRKRK